MKKVSNVTLGGVIFTIEDDAFAALGAYLDSVGRNFASYPEQDEIVADIEGRIAEKFSASMGARKKTVTLRDVEAVIQSMGTAEEVAETDPEPPAKDTTPRNDPRKRTRLYRNEDDAILGGVGSGIAAYFGADPVIVRLILFIIIFFGGFGVLLYLVLWLIVPPARTESEKLEMRGEPVTLAGLEAQLKERVEDVRRRDNGWTRRLFAFPAEILRAVFSFLQRAGAVILPIIGVVILLTSIAVAAGLSVVFATVLLSPREVLDVDLQAMMPTAWYFALLISAYLAIFIPVLAGIMLGSSLIKRRNVFGGAISTSLVIIWIAALVVGGNAVLRYAPQLRTNVEAAIDQTRSERSFDVAEASRVNLRGSTRLVVVQGDQFAVTARGFGRDIDHLDIESENGELTIGQQDLFRLCFFCVRLPVEVTVVTPSLEGLAMSGSGDAVLRDLRGDALEIESYGSGDVSADLTLQSLSVSTNGSSDLELRGTARSMEMQLHGSSDVDAAGLRTDRTSLEIDGSSDVALDVREELDVSLHGSGEVRYTGNPRVRQSISGSGDVVQLEAPAPPAPPEPPAA